MTKLFFFTKKDYGKVKDIIIFLINSILLLGGLILIGIGIEIFTSNI